jgi:HEAT repeat protein
VLVKVLGADPTPPGLRGNAAEALGRIRANPPLSVPALTDALRSPSIHVARMAVRALGEFGASAASAAPDIIAAVNAPRQVQAADPYPGWHDMSLRILRTDAAEALGKIATASLEVRRTLIKEAGKLDREDLPRENDPLSHVILGALGRSSSIDAVAPLRAALSSPHAVIRVEACIALDALGPVAAPALPELMRALDDEAPTVVQWASRAITELGPAAAPALPWFTSGWDELRDHELFTRIAQIGQIWASVGTSRLAETTLTKALEDARSFVREIAAEGFVRAGVFRPAALKIIFSRALAGDRAWRFYDRTNLGRLRAILDARLADLEPPTRERAVQVLNRLTAAESAVVEEEARYSMTHRFPNGLASMFFQPSRTLAFILRGGKVIDRFWAARSLGNLGKAAKEAAPDLIKALSDPSRSVRRISAEALGKIGVNTKEVRWALEHAREDPNEGVQRAAKQALERIKGG